MATLSQEDVRKRALALGIPAKDAKILSAIACAEAPAPKKPGYCVTDALGDLHLVGEKTSNGYTWGPSYSEFQIRTIKEHTGNDTFRDLEWLKKDSNNPILAAWSIVQSTGGYNAWTTYRSGAYLAYMQDVIPPKPGTYIVMSGDTFTLIDHKLKLERGTMQKLNPKVKPTSLFIGQVLNAPTPTSVEYTVKSGDTLYRIAINHKVTVEAIVKENNLPNSHLISPGQVLRIPKR